MPNLRQLVQFKQGDKPYMSSGPTLVVDNDSVPYTRFYRGRFDSDIPIIFPRDAGWKPRCDQNYVPIRQPAEIFYPNHCFQTAATTTYPCMPEYQRKYSDKKEMDIQLFRTRTNEYR